MLQDIDVALHRLPQDVVDARMQRLKRAVDCSLKKSYLSKELQDMQTPYSWYLKVPLHTSLRFLNSEYIWPKVYACACNTVAVSWPADLQLTAAHFHLH